MSREPCKNELFVYQCQGDKDHVENHFDFVSSFNKEEGKMMSCEVQWSWDQ